MAGYSGTPLSTKLGIKPGHTVFVRRGPPEFEDDLDPLPESVVFRQRAGQARTVDVAIIFCLRLADLRRGFDRARTDIKFDGGLWVAWPKKSSGVVTDITENLIREYGLGHGLVDNKICAINETWSGLRFVYRTKNRPQTR